MSLIALKIIVRNLEFIPNVRRSINLLSGKVFDMVHFEVALLPQCEEHICGDQEREQEDW